MENSFWFGYKLSDFLFPDFEIESPAGLIAVCICTAILVIVYESLKTSRIIKTLNSKTDSSVSFFKLAFSKYTEKSTLLGRDERPKQYREIWKISDIFFHFFELIIGYLLMLIAMTYNAYIMISIAIGAGLAYLLFGSMLYNVTAQVVAAKICRGCHVRTTDGDSTPVMQSNNEEERLNSNPPESTGESSKETVSTSTTTTVQIHA